MAKQTNKQKLDNWEENNNLFFPLTFGPDEKRQSPKHLGSWCYCWIPDVNLGKQGEETLTYFFLIFAPSITVLPVPYNFTHFFFFMKPMKVLRCAQELVLFATVCNSPFYLSHPALWSCVAWVTLCHAPAMGHPLLGAMPLGLPVVPQNSGYQNSFRKFSSYVLILFRVSQLHDWSFLDD